jgi:hypothetical protein
MKICRSVTVQDASPHGEDTTRNNYDRASSTMTMNNAEG